MKNLSLFFAVAAIIAVAASAFSSPKADVTVYGINQHNQPRAVLLSEEWDTWQCKSGTKHCIYSDAAMQNPLDNEKNFQFTTFDEK